MMIMVTMDPPTIFGNRGHRQCSATTSWWFRLSVSWGYQRRTPLPVMITITTMVTKAPHYYHPHHHHHCHGDQGPPTICANWPPLSDSAGRALLSAESHHMWCTSHQWGYHPLSKVSHHVRCALQGAQKHYRWHRMASRCSLISLLSHHINHWPVTTMDSDA